MIANVEDKDWYDKWRARLADKIGRVFEVNVDVIFGQIQMWINEFCKYMYVADECYY